MRKRDTTRIGYIRLLVEERPESTEFAFIKLGHAFWELRRFIAKEPPFSYMTKAVKYLNKKIQKL